MTSQFTPKVMIWLNWLDVFDPLLLFIQITECQQTKLLKEREAAKIKHM